MEESPKQLIEDVATQAAKAERSWTVGGAFLGALLLWRCVPRATPCGTHLVAVRTCLREHFDNVVARKKIKPKTK